MKKIIIPTHISDKVQEKALELLRYAARLYRKTSIFDDTLDEWYDTASRWEKEQLSKYMLDIENNLRVEGEQAIPIED